MGFLFYGHEVLQVECVIVKYEATRINTSVIHTTLGGFPLTRFWLRTLTHVNFNHVNKTEVRYKVLRLNVKLSDFLLLRLHNCSCDLSYIASILFANVNFTYARKNYATVDT